MNEPAPTSAQSTDRSDPPPTPELQHHMTAGWIVLALGALFTMLAWNHARDESHQHAQDRFRFHCLEVHQAMAEHLDACQSILRGAKGLLVSAGTIHRRQWHQYVSTLDIEHHHPGLQGIGVASRVGAAELESHTARLRAEGIAEYTVTPPGRREEYFPIVYLEPSEGRNPSILGFDLGSENVRRTAMDHARDSGQTTLSGRVRLVQDTGQRPQPACVMYVPVYAADAALDTPEERRRSLVGFTFAPLRVHDLMEGIFRLKPKELSLALYDGEHADPTNLLYSSHVTTGEPPFLSHTFTVRHGGHPWTVAMGASESFLSHEERQSAPLAAAAGAAATLLIVAITWSLSTTRHRALRLARDMTRELETSREEFRSVTENAHDPILTVSAEGIIAYLNLAATRAFDVRPEALVGQPLSTILPGIGPEMPVHTGRTLKVRARRRDGSTFPAELQLTRRATRGTDAYTAVVRDTSERDLAEALLLERESNLRQFIHDTPVAVAMFDRGMRYVMASQRWIREFNPGRADIIGACHYELFPDTPQSWREAHRRGLEGQVESCDEDAYPRQGGTEDWFRWEIRPWRDARGEVAGLIVFAEFITQRRRAEEAARAAALELEFTNKSLEQAIEHARQLAHEAESANCAKSLFLAAMSHEIRTPMNGILGFAGILRNSPLAPKQKEYVDVILQSGDALLTLINDILDFSKIEANRLDLVTAPFDLRLCIEDCIKLLLPRALEKDLQLNLSLAPDLPPNLVGDASRIRQVVLNLLSNAVKFTETGSVDVVARPVALSRERTRVEICVRDTGIGIAPEKMTRLFQPFSQADQTIHGRYGGTGLGLAISKRLAEAMNGTLAVESTEGAGSTFTFIAELGVEPAAPASTTDPAPAASAPKRPAKPTPAAPAPAPMPVSLAILVAEDNPVNSSVVLLYLKQLGQNADLAINGREAVERARQRTYDLILMDLHMPDLDGIAATQKILAEADPTLAPQIVALTASVTHEDEEACAAAGMVGFLNKPLYLVDLRKVLESVVARRSAAVARPTPEASSPPPATPAALAAFG